MRRVDDNRMAAILSVGRQYDDGNIVRMALEDLCADLNDARDAATALDDACNAAHAWLVSGPLPDAEYAALEQIIVDARNEARGRGVA